MVSVDPRPRIVERAGGALLAGARCRACGYRLSAPAPVCPLCRGELEDAQFGPGGTIWSLTGVHISVQERTAPYALAYVDIDDGPRILAHIDHGSGARVGMRVTLAGVTGAGDPWVELA